MLQGKTGHQNSETYESDQSDKMSFMVKREVKKLLEEGKLRLKEGNFDDAIKFYTHAVNADQSCALCHFNLGFAYQEHGNLSFAKERYEKAIELEPTCSLFIEHLGRLYFESKEYIESAKLFQRASLVGPIQPVSLGLWGRALYEQNSYEQAIDAFERLLDNNPETLLSIGAYFWCIMSHIKIGNTAAARRLTETMLSHKRIDPKVLFELGEQFIKLRCLGLARRIFERIIITKEETMIARLRLDDIKTLEDRIDEVLPLLYDDDEELVLRNIHALREFGNDRISKAFLSLAHSTSAPIREAVILYQTEYGYDVAEQIKPMLTDSMAYVRDAAFDYFVKLDLSDYLYDVLKGLNDEHQSIRLKVVRFAARFGTMETIPKLEVHTDAPENAEIAEDIRSAARQIKHRHQKKYDSLYRMNMFGFDQQSKSSSMYDWKRWLLYIFQAFALLYFVYFVLYGF